MPISSRDFDRQRTVAGAAQCDIENMTCTHASTNVTTTLGELRLTMAATTCATMSVTSAGGPTMLMRQPLRLTPASIPVYVRTYTAGHNACRRRTRCRVTYSESTGSEASPEEPTSIRRTGRKPALRNRLATTRGPPVTMRAGTLRHGAYASPAHVDRAPRRR